MTKEETAALAHERREKFLKIHGLSRLMEIKLLYEIWHSNDYESLGFGSFKDYMDCPVDSGGLDISRPWAIQLILTYKKYIVELGLPEKTMQDISPRKLYFLKDVITEENKDEVLGKAKGLTLSQLKVEQKGIDITTCTHAKTETLVHCLDCDRWTKEDVFEMHA